MATDVDALDAIARATLSREQLPGLGLAVARRGRQILARGYGHADASAGKAVSATTLFGVASVTKLATAISILQLCDSGELTLCTPVKHFYPGLVAAANNDIQIGHLLRHAAGWRGLDSRHCALDRLALSPLERDRPPLESCDDLVDHMNRCGEVAVAPPDQILNYSNEGFCLLGGIVARVAGTPWHHFIERQLFDPLGMRDSAVGNADENEFPSIATPLRRTRGGWQSAGFWDAPLFYPAGGIVTTCSDLLRMLSVLHDDGPLLSATSRAWLRRPAIAIASRCEKSFGYSAGLEFWRSPSGLCTHWHTGQRAGISSFVAASPDNGLSIALLANVADAPLTALGFKLLAQLDARYSAQWPPSADAPALTPAPIIGRYQSDEGFCFDVLPADDHWVLLDANSARCQVMQFQSATSGKVGQSTFAFLAADGQAPDRLALDLRVFNRRAS